MNHNFCSKHAKIGLEMSIPDCEREEYKEQKDQMLSTAEKQKANQLTKFGSNLDETLILRSHATTQIGLVGDAVWTRALFIQQMISMEQRYDCLNNAMATLVKTDGIFFFTGKLCPCISTLFRELFTFDVKFQWNRWNLPCVEFQRLWNKNKVKDNFNECYRWFIVLESQQDKKEFEASISAILQNGASLPQLMVVFYNTKKHSSSSSLCFPLKAMLKMINKPCYELDFQYCLHEERFKILQDALPDHPASVLSLILEY